MQWFVHKSRWQMLHAKRIVKRYCRAFELFRFDITSTLSRYRSICDVWIVLISSFFFLFYIPCDLFPIECNWITNGLLRTQTLFYECNTCPGEYNPPKRIDWSLEIHWFRRGKKGLDYNFTSHMKINKLAISKGQANKKLHSIWSRL